MTTHAKTLGRAEALYAVFLDYANSVKAQYKAYKKYRETVRDLSKLSERELNDIGLARGNIDDVAYEAAYRKVN